MPDKAPLVSARDYSFRINGRLLLDRVSFDILPGASCAIIGPNGAGKTTLLKSLCRLLPWGEGALTLAGRSLRHYPARELAALLAYVPQAQGFREPYTVREFVLLGRYPYFSLLGSISSGDRREVERVLEATGLQAFADRLLPSLSGGEQQKVLIAAALAQGSRVLVLDEPAAFLDPHQQASVYALLAGIQAQTDMTVIEVTHDVNRALLGHTHVLGLRDGRLIFDGTPEMLRTGTRLQEIYQQPFYFTDHPQLHRPMAVSGVNP